MHKTAKAKTKYLGVTAFRQQCEIYLSVLDDALIQEHYVKMFIANCTSGSCTLKDKDNKHPTINQTDPQQKLTDEELLLINTAGLEELLLTCFRIGIANYVASSGKNDLGYNAISAETFCPQVNTFDLN